jgi:3-hydroxyacyl-CoA dehydrogenase
MKISRNISVGHFFNPARYLKLFEIIPGPASQEYWTSLQYRRNF